jgi:hypothetical protein
LSRHRCFPLANVLYWRRGSKELSEGKVHARGIVKPPLTRTLNLIGLIDHPQTRAFVEVSQILRRVIIDEVIEGPWPAKLIRNRKHTVYTEMG